MWIVLNNAYLSIVKPTVADLIRAQELPANCTASQTRAATQELLCVRARAEGELERIFPGHKVLKWPGRDYPFRTFVRRSTVGGALARATAEIDYTNFKDSVKEADRHDAYLSVWTVMNGFGKRRAWHRRDVRKRLNAKAAREGKVEPFPDC